MGIISGFEEINTRESRGQGRFASGISFFDDAARGIFPCDMVLFAAPSGAGKTQAACEMMDAALGQGKRVLYVALEAERGEIESRLKWKLYMKHHLQLGVGEYVDPVEWMLGGFIGRHPATEQRALDEFDQKYKNAHIHYKGTGAFTVHTLIEVVMRYADEVDLIIIDHLHFFDFEPDESENRAVKTIMTKARDLAISESKPIVLVSHIRKSDRRIKQLVPDQEDLHGSSDIFKIATKVFTLAPGKEIRNGSYETFMRCCKFRWDGGVTRFVARMFYSPKGGGYEESYELGSAFGEEFKPLERDAIPRWAKRAVTPGSGNDSSSASDARGIIFGGGAATSKNMFSFSKRN